MRALLERTLMLVLVLASSSWPALQARAKGPKHHKRGKGHFHIGVGPQGITYGYHRRGFAIDVGVPSSYHGYRWYDGSYFDGPSYFQYANPHVEYLPSTPPHYVDPPIPDRGYSSRDFRRRLVVPRGDEAIIPTIRQAAEFQKRAEWAFYGGSYEESLRMVGHAIMEDRDNGLLRLFESQVKFALGQYLGAVDSLDQGLARVAAADRGFVVSNYRRFYRGQTYVQQMDRLVQYEKNYPHAAHAKLLRAYHYLFLGHDRAAQTLLQAARESRSAGDRKTGDVLASMLEDTLHLNYESLPPPEPTPETTELP